MSKRSSNSSSNGKGKQMSQQQQQKQERYVPMTRLQGANQIVVAQEGAVDLTGVDSAILARVTRAFYRLLPQLTACLTTEASTLPFVTGMSRFEGGTKAKPYWYRKVKAKSDSSILLVAHTDVVADIEEVYVRRNVKSGNNLFFSPACDDRLGVFTILYLLPLLGIKEDVLLTTDEERGATTGEDFAAQIKEGHTYNWMAEFDRCGDDVALYDYFDDAAWNKVASDAFIAVDYGSFTDITSMTAMGVCGINVSCGYHRPHTDLSYFIAQQYIAQVARFIAFYEQWKGTRFDFDAKAHRDSRYSRFSYDCYHDYGTGHYTSETDESDREDGYVQSRHKSKDATDWTHVIGDLYRDGYGTYWKWNSAAEKKADAYNREWLYYNAKEVDDYILRWQDEDEHLKLWEDGFLEGYPDTEDMERIVGDLWKLEVVDNYDEADGFDYYLAVRAEKGKWEWRLVSEATALAYLQARRDTAAEVRFRAIAKSLREKEAQKTRAEEEERRNREHNLDHRWTVMFEWENGYLCVNDRNNYAILRATEAGMTAEFKTHEELTVIFKARYQPGSTQGNAKDTQDKAQERQSL